MNRRILKKRCKRAMEVLIAEHGYRASDFTPAEGEESINAPVGMKGRGVRKYGTGECSSAWLEPGPLPGTPLLWLKTSYECDEWDAKLPAEVLTDLIFWEVCHGRAD